MQIAVYVIYELLIRLQELNPAVGEYISHKKTDDGILVRSSTGVIAMPEDILFRQFNDPATISQHEVLGLQAGFKLSVA
ncbi:hypothetical protein [Pedobacter sp. V48]|uniref:hypothetical protein n=1 Tax=Pedobacter sp. V48 TaxID=509635 RepID=UPI0003E5465F|nr:hypothetical protein [Pedobacter sp. V48]ETZ19146.1 hypothetical protein N824_10410 [Pedobacter sp. V48]